MRLGTVDTIVLVRLGHSQGSFDGVIRWAVLFGLIGGFYVATFSFRGINDTALNSYQTRALALHADVDLARYDVTAIRHGYSVERGDDRYSIYGVGVSMTALPIYAVVARLGASDKVLQAAAAIPFVAAAALILLRLLLRMFPRPVALGATIVYAFGTTMWPLATMGFFQHGPASFYQAIGLTGLFSDGARAPLLAGVGFGAAAFVRPTLFIPLLIVGVFYLIQDRRSALLFFAPAVLVVLGVLVQNRWIWGSWLSGGYAQAGPGFNGDMPEALFGLLFGWWRGMFAYSPVLVVGVAGLVIALRKTDGLVERKMIALGASVVVMVLFYARWTTWHGGQNQFGYRYLLDVVPFLVVLGAFAVARSERIRTIAIPLAVLSVMTMTFGAGPSRHGFDGGLFPPGLEQTSLGQAWLVFVNHPLDGILRLLGVAAITALLWGLAARDRTEVGTA